MLARLTVFVFVAAWPGRVRRNRPAAALACLRQPGAPVARRGIALPSGLDWLQSVVRTGMTPVALLAVTVILVLLLWPHRRLWPQRPARRARA